MRNWLKNSGFFRLIKSLWFFVWKLLEEPLSLNSFHKILSCKLPFHSLFFKKVLLVFLILFAFVTTSFFIFNDLQVRRDQAKYLVINNAKIISVAPVAGEKVKWISYVKVSDIKNDQKYIKLPKNAKNIVVKKIKGKDLLTLKVQSPSISLLQKQKLAGYAVKKNFVANIFDIVKNSFLASTEDALNQLAGDVVATPEATFVDVSSQTDAKQPVISDDSNEKQSAIDTVESTELVSSETESENNQDNELPISSIDKDVADGEALAGKAEQLQDPLQPESQSVQTVETISSTDPVFVINEEEELVAVEYTTPEDTIIIEEQPTNTGKLVIISYGEDVKQNEGSLNQTIANQNSASIVSTITDDQPIEVKPVENKEILEIQQPPELLVTENIKTDKKQLVEENKKEDGGKKETDEVIEKNEQPIVDVKEDSISENVLENKIEQTEVSAKDLSQEFLDSGPINVLAHTTIPEMYTIEEKEKIQLKWQNNGNQNVDFTAYDLDNNKKIDYIEWIIPHLSEQIFEIIYISKASKLDKKGNIVSDVYKQLSKKDNVWESFKSGEYVRVTFERKLDNSRDITIFAKKQSGKSASIEVYKVGTSDLIATFENINTEGTYKILLTNLASPSDVFDLKIVGKIDIDYIVDPILADAYWVGGSGNWSDAKNHWAAESGGKPNDTNLPSTGTNVHFDSNSGTGTVNIDGNVSVADLISLQEKLEIICSGNNEISVSGNLDLSGGSFVPNESTIKLTGIDKQINANNNSSTFYNITIADDASVIFSDSLTNNYYFINSLIVDGILNLGNGKPVSLVAKKGSPAPKVFIGGLGKITGESGEFVIINWPELADAGMVEFEEGGVIDVGLLKIIHPRQDSILAPANYNSKEVVVSEGGVLVLSKGNYIFENDVVLENNNDEDLVIGNNVNEPDVLINKDFILKTDETKNIVMENIGSGNGIIKGSIKQEGAGNGVTIWK